MTKNESAIPAIMSILLLLSVAGNVAMGLQIIQTQPQQEREVWLSSQSTMRGTLSGEQRLMAGMQAPEYDYAFGMRKNMQLDKANCLLDECFLNMDMSLPVGELPESYAQSVRDLARQEREVANRLEAESMIRSTSPLLKNRAGQDIRVAVLSFLETKYGITPDASVEGIPLASGDADLSTSCQQMQSQLLSLQTAYEVELARSDIDLYPDLAYVYRQLLAQTRSIHLPIAQSCTQ